MQIYDIDMLTSAQLFKMAKRKKQLEEFDAKLKTKEYKKLSKGLEKAFIHSVEREQGAFTVKHNSHDYNAVLVSAVDQITSNIKSSNKNTIKRIIKEK